MRLFIFEGPADKNLFDTLKRLYFGQSDDDVCVYNSSIYSLYSKMNQYAFSDVGNYGETLTILNDILLEKGDSSLDEIVNSDKEVSEVYLFFDYDFQDDRHSLEENNVHIQELLDFFVDETENGKLYISYPMLEAYRHIKSLPDDNFNGYTITRQECNGYKKYVGEFTKIQPGKFALTEKEWNKPGFFEKREPDLKKNWNLLIPMNVRKANMICNNINEMPHNKEDISQQKIFEGQIDKYVNKNPCSVAVLSSFPIFIYEYLK